MLPTASPARRLEFGNNGTNITSVSDGTGRTWNYSYHSDVYRLKKVTGPAGSGTEATERCYKYYTTGLLTGLMKEATESDDSGDLTTQFTYYPNKPRLRGHRLRRERDPDVL